MTAAIATAAELQPLDARPPADQHPAVVYLAGLRAGSGRAAQRAALDRFARDLTAGTCDAQTLPWHRIRYQHAAAVRSLWTDSQAAPATINARLSAIRGTARAAWRLGQIDTDAYMRLKDIPNVHGSRLPTGRAIPRAELVALFDACSADHTPAGTRDAALFAILLGTGCRRAEAASLQLSDWDPPASRLTVVGKGNKQRHLYLAENTRAALTAWIQIRGTAPGHLFNAVNRHGRIDLSKGLTGQAISARIQGRARQARIPPCSPHDFRRSHVSAALDAGADLLAVAQNAGHASPTTTARYDRRGEAAQRKAAAAVHVPFVPSCQKQI